MPPSSVGHNDIYYKVECQLCPEKPHSFMPCENISIGKEGMNLTKTNLTVAHLYNNTCYKFSVTTLNGVSTEANKKHWNSAMIRVQFSGKTNRNHPDARKLIWKNHHWCKRSPFCHHWSKRSPFFHHWCKRSPLCPP